MWMAKVMTTIYHTNNDASLRNTIQTIRNKTDKLANTTMMQPTMIDSQVIDDMDNTVPTPYANHIESISDTGQDKDNPNIFELSWKYEEDKWKPPESSTINIVKTDSPTIAQTDSGANRIVTNDMKLLQNIKFIEPMPMSGCNSNEPAAITCTAMGDMTLQSKNLDRIKVKCYYLEQVDGTIISPTTIITQHKDKYNGWMQFSNCDNRTGKIKLIPRAGHSEITFATICNNDLWYHDPDSIGPTSNSSKTPQINRLSNAAKFELWHQRLGHPGLSTMQIIHKHVKGITALKGNSFYRCPSCMSGKLCTKVPIGKKVKNNKLGASIPSPPTQPQHEMNDSIHLPESSPGQHFHMDFGFVCGAEYSMRTEDGKTVTSLDGKKAYLLIIDRSSRYTWIFTTDSKVPPIKIAQKVLNKFKSTNPHRTVRVDQGGELGKSQAFKNMVAEEKFSLELTGSDASAQNSTAKNPNKVFGQMMRCMLHSAELGPEYWSWALAHAVYIKNRLPHHTIKISPYEKFTGTQPDVSNIRIFGSCVYAKEAGKRRFKLDHGTRKGTFLGFTATDKIITYIDKETGKVKTATHAIFDEAHFTVPASQAPLAAQTLQRLGYYAKEDWKDGLFIKFNDDATGKFLIQKLTTTAKIPERGSKESIGYDIFADATDDIIIPPGNTMPIPTGLAMKCPTNTYARIAPRSGLTIKKNLTTMVGVIDRDYQGNVTVLLRNFGSTQQTIKPGDKIAQIILERAEIAEMESLTELDETT
jgi:dUTP pyrophosphatase